MANYMLDEAQLCNIFSRVDKDQTGQINGKELQGALSNGTWRPFNTKTVRLMISMFDSDKSGTVNLQEFKQLWKYVNDWLMTFQRFDSDKSGNISRHELVQALTSFGYRFSDAFYSLMMEKYGSGEKIDFDNFLLLCISLQSLTNSFKTHDREQRGTITIGYEDFLSLVMSNVALMA